jgi:putative hemolysin
VDIIGDMASGALQSIAIVLGLIALGAIFVAAEIALISYEIHKLNRFQLKENVARELPTLQKILTDF